MTHQNKYLPYLMWSLPLLFFAYQFVLRLWPSLMMQQIMQQFEIGAGGYGALASAYYFGYAGMQIPVAFWCGRWGTRWILAASAMVCGLATCLFSFTDSWVLALMCRFLVGAGSAVGFLGVSQVISEWFPKQQYARMIGFSFTLGLMGAIYGGRPVSAWVDAYSWQSVAEVLALMSVALGIASACWLKSPQLSNGHVAGSESEGFQWSDFKKLLSSPYIWGLAIANLLMVGTLEGFSDAWGVQYLSQAHGFSKGDAAGLVSFIFIGMLFGGPVLAFLTKKWGHFTVLIFTGVIMTVCFTQLLFGAQHQTLYFGALFFCLGIMCCYQVIVFALGAEWVQPALLGVTVAFLNCVNMMGGSVFHNLIGQIMDAHWIGLVNNDGVRQYSVQAFQLGLSTIPACSLLGALVIGWMGLSRARQGKRLATTGSELTNPQ